MAMLELTALVDCLIVTGYFCIFAVLINIVVLALIFYMHYDTMKIYNKYAKEIAELEKIYYE